MVSASKLLATGALLFASAFAEADVKGSVNKMSRVMKLKEEFYQNNKERFHQGFASVLGSPQECTGGSVTVDGVTYECNNVDFLSAVGKDDLIRSRESFPGDSIFEMADIWGWQSPTGREVTIACMTNVLWFIDSTDPLNPSPMGYIESHREESFWCDAKVYQDTVYIVQDRFSSSPGLNNRGMQVFDLLRLESEEVLNAEEPVNLAVDFTYEEHGAVHNTLVNTDSGFLYNVGTRGGNDCAAGLHIVDLSNRLEPTFAACAAQDEYVHDAQCVNYKGPDAQFVGREICFGYNEDTLTIYDVTDKNNIALLSRTGYTGTGYTHQGWLNRDQDFLLLDDETDELDGIAPLTRTFIVDVTSLENPIFTGIYEHPVDSIDHNLYFWGVIHEEGWGGNPPLENPPNPKFAYCANYASGLRVLDTTGIKQSPPVLEEAGFFDVSPTFQADAFFGTWSSYMHPSGVIAVTVIESGVFFLNFTDAFAEDGPVTFAPTGAPIESVDTVAPTVFPTSPVDTFSPTASPTESVITEPPVSAPVAPPTEDGGSGGDADAELLLTLVFVLFGLVIIVSIMIIFILISRRNSAGRAVEESEELVGAEIVGGKKTVNPIFSA